MTALDCVQRYREIRAAIADAAATRAAAGELVSSPSSSEASDDDDGPMESADSDGDAGELANEAAGNDPHAARGGNQIASDDSAEQPEIHDGEEHASRPALATGTVGGMHFQLICCLTVPRSPLPLPRALPRPSSCTPAWSFNVESWMNF